MPAPRAPAPPERAPADLAPRPDEPPVVARLVVELRSDGRTTIARGALEDHLSGETVGLEARAASPIELAAALARSLLQAPALAGAGLRAALPGPRELGAEARLRLGALGRRLRGRLGR